LSRVWRRPWSSLHGCTENDVGFDLLTGWSEAAERHGFIVVWQGTADPVVPPSTADRIAVQWAGRTTIPWPVG
jgi:poly(3-hydroxybutyrate) depolymerase